MKSDSVVREPEKEKDKQVRRAGLGRAGVTINFSQLVGDQNMAHVLGTKNHSGSVMSAVRE